MSWRGNSIRAKLVAVLSALVLMIAVLGTASLSAFDYVNKINLEISEVWHPSLLSANLLKATANDMQLALYRHILASDERGMDNAELAHTAVSQALRNAIDQFNVKRLSSEGLAAFDDFKLAATSYERKIADISILSRRYSKEAATGQYLSSAAGDFGSAMSAVDKIIYTADRSTRSAQLEAKSISTRAALVVKLLVFLAVAFAIMTAWLSARSIGAMVDAIVRPVRDLADGRLDIELPKVDQTELGRISGAIEIFRDALIMKKVVDGRVASENNAKIKRALAIDALMDGFERSVGTLKEDLANASGELKETSFALGEIAQTMNNHVEQATEAADRTSCNIQSVAEATDGLAAATMDIVKQTGAAHHAAGLALIEIKETESIIGMLLKTAGEIGGVVKLIGNVATQTNLLALNASIEAARAGLAGRGFAVVAGEVKVLAHETSTATNNVADQIAALQNAAADAAKAINSIRHSIGILAALSDSIAAASSLQDATTRGISENVNSVAAGTVSVVAIFSDVRSAAQRTDSLAKEMMVASAQLDRQSSFLKHEISLLVEHIKAA